jgi:hypothetical protein
MSEKKWKIDSRVPHKYRGGRRGKGSEFPRHGMNEYEGERLSMGKHQFSKHKTMIYNKSYGWASLHIKYMDGLLNKYVNRPFDEMLSEFYAKTKSLRQSRRQRMWDAQSYFSHDLEGTKHARYAQNGEKRYYVDEEGVLRLKEKWADNAPNTKLTRKQKAYNLQVSVPTFGLGTDQFAQLKQKYDTTDLFVGEYYAIVEEEVRKVPVYTSPKVDSGHDLSNRIAIRGFNLDTKFNNVFRKYTYKEENSYKTMVREKLEALKKKNNEEDANEVSRMERRLSSMKDYWTIHGCMALEFYTKK